MLRRFLSAIPPLDPGPPPIGEEMMELILKTLGLSDTVEAILDGLTD